MLPHLYSNNAIILWLEWRIYYHHAFAFTTFSRGGRREWEEDGSNVCSPLACLPCPYHPLTLLYLLLPGFTCLPCLLFLLFLLPLPYFNLALAKKNFAAACLPCILPPCPLPYPPYHTFPPPTHLYRAGLGWRQWHGKDGHFGLDRFVWTLPCILSLGLFSSNSMCRRLHMHLCLCCLLQRTPVSLAANILMGGHMHAQHLACLAKAAYCVRSPPLLSFIHVCPRVVFICCVCLLVGKFVFRSRAATTRAHIATKTFPSFEQNVKIRYRWNVIPLLIEQFEQFNALLFRTYL